MAIVDLDITEIADVLLRRNMLRNGGLEQIEVRESFLSYEYYISKPYIAELRFKQIPSDEFDRKIAKLKLFNFNIDELEGNEIKLEGGNSYIMQDLNDEDMLIEIEEEPAFTAENWRLYRKYKDVFKEELDTCMYEITTKESLARAGIELEEIQEEEKEITLKAHNTWLIERPDRSSYNLSEEIPIRYVVTISSKTPIEIDYEQNIRHTVFTYFNLKDTYINIDAYKNKGYRIMKFISSNIMLKKLDMSGVKLKSIKQVNDIIEDNPRLKTIIFDLSNIKLSEEKLKESKTSGIKINI